MRIKFNCIEELEYRNLTYADKKSEKNIEEMLDKEIEVYYDENYFVWSEGGQLLGYLKELE